MYATQKDSILARHSSALFEHPLSRHPYPTWLLVSERESGRSERGRAARICRKLIGGESAKARAGDTVCDGGSDGEEGEEEEEEEKEDEAEVANAEEK